MVHRGRSAGHMLGGATLLCLLLLAARPARCQLISSWEDFSEIGPGGWVSDLAQPQSNVLLNFDSANGVTEGVQSFAITQSGGLTGGSMTHFDRPAVLTIPGGDPRNDLFSQAAASPFDFELQFDVTFDPNMLAAFPEMPEVDPFLAVGVFVNSDAAFQDTFNVVFVNTETLNTLSEPLTVTGSVPAADLQLAPQSSFYQIGFTLNGNWLPQTDTTILIDRLQFSETGPPADLDGNGNLDVNDWVLFLASHKSDLSALMPDQAFARGDLDGDLDNDFEDFLLFERAWDGVNGPGAFEAMLAGVPEPASLGLLVAALAVGCFAAARYARRRRALVVAAAVFWTTSTPATAQLLHSWESGLENWQVVSFADRNVRIDTSVLGATDGNQSLAITQEDDGFSWTAQVTWGQGAPQFDAFAEAVAVGLNNYLFELDVTYDTSEIPQTQPPSFLNLSIALNSDANWSQVDGLATTSGTLNETIHISEPLDRWSLGGGFYQVNLGLNGDWGLGDATVLFDNLRITQISQPALLTLQVDPGNGDTILRNLSGQPIELDYYEITSDTSALDPVGWNSLDAQNIDAVDGDDPGSEAGDSPLEGWDAGGGASSNDLTEAFLLGSTTLSDQASLSLGKAYAAGRPPENEDLVFRFRDPARPDSLLNGIVEFLPFVSPLAADFDGDGDADRDDYLAWQANFGSLSAAMSSGDSDGDGDVDGKDFLTWQQQSGRTAAATETAATAVPELQAAWLMAVSLLTCAARPRRLRSAGRCDGIPSLRLP